MDNNFFKASVWYPSLAAKTFLTTFVKLRSESVKALAEGITEDKDPQSPVNLAINDMKEAMGSFFGHSFVFTDCCAPTDTERFLNKKGGKLWYICRAFRCPRRMLRRISSFKI